MKWIKYIALVGILAFMFTCASPKVIGTDTLKSISKDSSTITTITPKFDTIRLPSEELKVTIPIKDLSEIPIISISKTGRLQSSVKKVKENLEVECFMEEYIQIIVSQNKTIETLIKVIESQENKTTVKVTESPWYMKALAAIGIAALITIAIVLIIKK